MFDFLVLSNGNENCCAFIMLGLFPIDGNVLLVVWRGVICVSKLSYLSDGRDLSSRVAATCGNLLGGKVVPSSTQVPRLKN
jgi:hypothetical protein